MREKRGESFEGLPVRRAGFEISETLSGTLGMFDGNGTLDPADPFRDESLVFGHDNEVKREDRNRVLKSCVGCGLDPAVLSCIQQC